MEDGLRTEAAAAASSSDRGRWERILANIWELLRQKESEIETLVGDRGFLEEYVHKQHDRWVSKTRTLEAQIAHLRKEADCVKKVEAASFDYLMKLKNQETECYKVELEHAKTDMEDLIECIKNLSHQTPKNMKLRSRSACIKASEGTAKVDENRIAALKEKVKKVNLAYKKLASEKESKIAALLAEKNFIWNQFQKIDEECTSLRKTTSLQLAQSNEAAEKFQATIESLQEAVVEKDDEIINLKAKVASLELDLQRQSEEAELSSQILTKHQKDNEELRTLLSEKDEIIRKLKIPGVQLDTETPETSHCRTRLQKQKSVANHRCASADPTRRSERTSEEEHSVQNRNGVPLTRSRLYALSESTGLKRCATMQKSTRMLESPRLFSSNFKIPKLRNTSSPW